MLTFLLGVVMTCALFLAIRRAARFVKAKFGGFVEATRKLAIAEAKWCGGDGSKWLGGHTRTKTEVPALHPGAYCERDTEYWNGSCAVCSVLIHVVLCVVSIVLISALGELGEFILRTYVASLLGIEVGGA